MYLTLIIISISLIKLIGDTYRYTLLQLYQLTSIIMLILLGNNNTFYMYDGILKIDNDILIKIGVLLVIYVFIINIDKTSLHNKEGEMPILIYMFLHI